MVSRYELFIRPRKGWQPVDFREVYLQRELLFFFIWRDVKIRYRQTLLGGVWAVMQPLFAMLVFTVLFHRLAGLNGDKNVPYPLFAFAGLSAWTFFSTALSQSSNSLVTSAAMVKKVYFPRIFLPLASVGALLVDLAFSLLLQAVLMLKYHWHLTTSVLLLPVFIFGTVMSAAGLGMILSAVNVRFRDVKYVVPFMIQMGIFLTPVIYPVRYIPQKWMLLMGLNPMAGMVIGFRHALLGSQAPWSVIGLSFAVSISMFFFGLYFFRRMERHFADVI